jgi:outer membrane receptor for ferrienterochelin and colicins
MIDERGYQTLVDICQDVPGFDFMMYNDGGGEYPTYNMHRGMGDIGNPEILIMVDGVIQNNISFNWSLLWTYDNIFIDVDQIEIIQGPGSVMYGAQAFSGVINIITDKKFNGAEVKSFCGSNQTYGNDVHIGISPGDNINFSVTFHKYNSNGDHGIGRYDPGSYFKNNKYPAIILADYDSAGNYIQDYVNPKGGQSIPDGFNTENNSYALRVKLSYKNSELGYFIADAIRGNSSALAPYEYAIFEKDNTHHYRSFHSYFTTTQSINSKFDLVSKIVFRGTHILPDGGFKYLYQFPNLTKRYAAYAYQAYLEENLLFDLNDNNVFSFGAKGSISQKSERIVSLGGQPGSHFSTRSSWDIAVAGNGIEQPKEYPDYLASEIALFALWDRQWLNNVSSSAGLRYDYSSEYGSILNPRFAIDYNPKPVFGAKFMFGTAFRQPSIFELTSEYRGNPNLKPQSIKTTELELNSILNKKRISLKFNIYYSLINQPIGKVADSSMPSGERYENVDEVQISGFTLYFSGQPQKNIRFYSNYNFLTGIRDGDFEFYEIEHVGRHKINAGVNIKALEDKFIADLRMNFVGKRKAHKANTWLQAYEHGYAPGYTKFNLSVSYSLAKKLMAQILINNLFNAQYYGHGRETGSGFIDDYDYLDNVNPAGHIPAYHPQPGRTFLINLAFKFNDNG